MVYTFPLGDTACQNKKFSWEAGWVFLWISPFDKNLFYFVKISCLDIFTYNILIFLFQITFFLKYVIFCGTKNSSQKLR